MEGINTKFEKEFFVQDRFFNEIEAGLKTLELRVAFDHFASTKEGDIVLFKTGSGNQLKVRVKRTTKYNSIEEVRSSEDMFKLAPGVSDSDLNNIALRLFKPKDVDTYGLLVFEFEKINN